MKKIVDDLWYGNVDPSVSCREMTEETRSLMEYIARHHDDLQATFTDDQKKLFEKFDDCCVEMAGINERKIFSFAFRLGAKLAIEIMETELYT